MRSPVAVGVRDFDGLVRAISARRQLITVYWFGHGAGGELQFGNSGKFTLANLGSIAGKNLSAHFIPGAEIVFAACNAVLSPELLQGIADALRVTVRGYSTGIKWSVSYKGDAQRRKITRRGLDDGTEALKSAGTPYQPRPAANLPTPGAAGDQR
jgi:hypothetical protein